MDPMRGWIGGMARPDSAPCSLIGPQNGPADLNSQTGGEENDGKGLPTHRLFGSRQA
jgi:hypothetical protein